MLKLKRVELQGFKSFCDRSDMKFHGSGIAAIVGPNGCGKSNLSDAISWVLGEQSAKSLRGARMEDVIFAGTRERKPLGMAQVSMTMVDPRVHVELPIADTEAVREGKPEKNEEITITRRLFRSGDSEYLINGRQARLRDIQDLFMGSGLGPESYAIIEQGRIGQILSTKPADRRAVLEEAAGITRFKTKKRLAEAKLESAKQNLTRVFDILEEVSRQANSLKRQASKARRYSELRTEMIAKMRLAIAGRYRMVEREAAKTALDLNAASAEYQRLNAQVTELEAEQARLQGRAYETESELTEARRQLSDAKIEAERTRGKLQNQANQIGTFEQRLNTGEAESEQLLKRFEQLQLELDEHSRRVVELDQQYETARLALMRKEEERQQLQGELREKERSLETSRQLVLRLLGESSTLKNQLAQIEQHLVGVERDRTRIRRDEESAAGELERLNVAKDALSARQSARQLELRGTSEERALIEEELSTRKATAAETRRKLEQLRHDASRLKARRDSLEEILSHRAYTTESVKRLFTAVERGQTQNLRPAGVLADFVEVDAAHEKATEEFLHDELEYVVVKDWGQAEQGIDVMRGDVDGRATFLIHPEPGDNYAARPIAEPAIGPETGIIGKLSDCLRMTNGLTHAPAELIPRLARCYLAENRSTAQRLALQYPDLYFLLPEGVCYHGHAVSGGRKKGSGPLGLKRELREITAQSNQSEAELQRAQSMLQSLEEDIARLTEDLDRLRALQQTQEKDAIALDHEMRKLGDELHRTNSRLSVARLDLQRLDQETERSQARLADNQRLVEEKEAARLAQEQSLTEAREKLTDLQQEAARIGEEHSALRVELAGFDERRRGERNAQNRVENQIRDIAHRRQNLTAELERIGIEKARLVADNVELEARAAELAEQIAVQDGVVSKLVEMETGLRTELTVADERLKTGRHDSQLASEKRSQVELELVRRQSELKYLDETCRKELGIGVAELQAELTAAPAESQLTVEGESPSVVENAEAATAVASIDLESLDESAVVEAEESARDLRNRIEALGPVNTQAVEEFEEAQQRYEFLNTQRQDLLDSIRDTEKAIQEIDVESRKRFTEAFEAINANFREMFKTLFGGGVGEMRLTDQENAIESGIDIVASPPGKKLQSVLLLSGGERALTAMALLMAIFKYQPSPFCVLDEVDAPLDEANIERLMRLLKQMSSTTQFIVITHSKRTMEAAQALYGVTMQEPGVSKLVSVRFNEPVAAPPPPTQSPEPMLALQ